MTLLKKKSGATKEVTQSTHILHVRKYSLKWIYWKYLALQWKIWSIGQPRDRYLCIPGIWYYMCFMFLYNFIPKYLTLRKIFSKLRPTSSQKWAQICMQSNGVVVARIWTKSGTCKQITPVSSSAKILSVAELLYGLTDIMKPNAHFYAFS